MYARLPDGKTSLFQWDTKQYLEVSDDVTRVDFCFRIAPEVVYGVFAKNGKCYIPNLLIQKAGIIDALIMSTAIGTTTDRRLEIPVEERPIPPGYVATKDGAIISYDDLEDLIGEMNFLSTNGGTMAGDINMDGRKITGLVDPVEDGDAARKRYVDTEISTAAGNAETNAKEASLPRAGGSMTGNIDLGGNALTNVKSPAADADAATKGYVDERIVIYQNVSVPASAWASGGTVGGAMRPIYADVTLSNVTSNMYVSVVFKQDDIEAYNFASTCYVGDGFIEIYAETAPTVAITIPTIICLKA